MNAALITAIVGIFTLLFTSLISSYYNHRSLLVTIRDQIFNKRIHVYQELHYYASHFYQLIYDYINQPTPENAKKIQEYKKEIATYVRKNRFHLSSIVSDLTLNLTAGAEYLITNQKTFKRLTKELSIEKVFIIDPKDLTDRFHTIYLYPLLQQFEKELGLKKIESELKNLIS